MLHERLSPSGLVSNLDKKRAIALAPRAGLPERSLSGPKGPKYVQYIQYLSCVHLSAEHLREGGSAGGGLGYEQSWRATRR